MLPRSMLPGTAPNEIGGQPAATAEASIKAAVRNNGQRCSLTLRPYRFVMALVSKGRFH
jgi:hypothetical protein